jgi:hypothetical protein
MTAELTMASGHSANSSGHNLAIFGLQKGKSIRHKLLTELTKMHNSDAAFPSFTLLYSPGHKLTPRPGVLQLFHQR